MSQCTPRFMSLCANPKRVSPEGQAGANSFMYLPFSTRGIYFFGGGTYTFPNATIPQQRLNNVSGVKKVGVYSKYSTETPCAG